MADERPDPFRRRPRQPEANQPIEQPEEPAGNAGRQALAGSAVAGTVTTGTMVLAEPGGPPTGALEAGTMVWLFEQDPDAQLVRVSAPNGTRGWVKSSDLEFDPVLVPLRQGPAPAAAPPPAAVYDPPTRITPPTPRPAEPPTRVAPLTPPPRPAEPVASQAPIGAQTPISAAPPTAPAAPAVRQVGGRASYEYRVMPFVAAGTSAEAVSAQLADLIANECQQGWEFYRIDQVHLQKKGGLGGDRSLALDQVIFRRTAR